MMDAETYSVSLGLTVNVDQGFNFLRDTPDLPDSSSGPPGIETFSPWTFYDAALALDRENKLTARLRIFSLRPSIRTWMCQSSGSGCSTISRTLAMTC